MPAPDDKSFPNPPVAMLKAEFEALADLVCASPRATPGIKLLWQELKRAKVLAEAAPPAGLVTIGSWVRFTELDTGRSRRARLTYAADPAASEALSVTSSLGAALIGLATGAVFHWRAPEGTLRGIRVDEVSSHAPSPNSKSRPSPPPA